MNLPLLGKIAGCIFFSTTSLISIINFKPPESSVYNEPEPVATQSETANETENVEEHTKETPQVEPTPSDEATEAVVSPVKNAQPKTNNSSTTKTQTNQAPAQRAQTPTNQNTQLDQKRYTSIYDFEHAMLGVCPQNVSSEVWPDKLRPIVSLGYRPEERYSSNDIELAIDIYWSAYKQGTQSSIITYTGGFFGGDCTNGEKSTEFVFNFTDNTVTYKMPSFYTPKGEQWAKDLAQRGQAHLQSINSQFKAKCGY